MKSLPVKSSVGEVAVGEVTVGEVTVGEVIVGEVIVGEVIFGEVTHTLIKYQRRIILINKQGSPRRG